MSSINALIVDDEDLARKNLQVLLEDYCPEVNVVGTAGGMTDALKQLETLDIDLLLLDIEMPNGSGFELLENLGPDLDFKVIFITAYHEYALKAFKFSAVDYLLKPINPEELSAAIRKVAKGESKDAPESIKMLMETMEHRGEQFNKIALPSMEGLQFVNLDDIAYCESQDNYTKFFLRNGERIMVSKTIKYFEEVLDQHGFFRVHRSNIINLKYIDRYVKGEGGYVVLDQGARIPVSRRRKEAFLQLFKVQATS